MGPVQRGIVAVRFRVPGLAVPGSLEMPDRRPFARLGDDLIGDLRGANVEAMEEQLRIPARMQLQPLLPEQRVHRILVREKQPQDAGVEVVIARGEPSADIRCAVHSGVKGALVTAAKSCEETSTLWSGASESVTITSQSM